MAQFVDGAHRRKGVSRRNFLKLSFALGGAAALAGAGTDAAFAEEAAPAPKYPSDPVKFAVMSDTHYFSPDLWGDNYDYHEAENSDRKMFKESRGILKKALADCVDEGVQLVLLPGDLTKDGELVCHQQVKELFEDARKKLAAKGVDCKFLVINGNHDLRNFNGKDFHSGHAEDAEHTEPMKLKEIWGDIYDSEDVQFFDRGGSGDGSLTYAARPFPGLTVLGVDTCKYNETDELVSQPHQVTEGDLPAEVQKWVCAQAKAARDAGDLVIAIQHHGVVPHFDDEPSLMWQYLVGPQGGQKYKEVAKAYADAGISAVLTGHMHANDVAKDPDCGIYDIETGSLVTYPSYMRMGTLEFKTDSRGATIAELSVDAHDLGNVAFEGCGLDGASADKGITEYGSTRTLTKTAVQTMICSMAVDPLLEMAQTVDLKSALAGLLGSLDQTITAENMNDKLWAMLTSIMGRTPEDGLQLTLPDSIPLVGGTVISIFYDEAADQIKADKMGKRSVAKALKIKLTRDQEAALVDVFDDAGASAFAAAKNTLVIIEHAKFGAFLDKTIKSVETAILRKPGSDNVVAVVKRAIELLLDFKVDSSHDVLALADTAYQAHLLGCEATAGKVQPWFETATEGVKNGLLVQDISDAVDAIVSDKTLLDLAKSVKIDLDALLSAGNVPIISNALVGVIVGLVPDLSVIFNFVNGDSGLGDLVGGVVPDSLVELAHSALYTLSHDSNLAEDHAFAVPSVAVAGSNANGGGAGNGGTTGNGGGTGNGGNTGNGSGNAGGTGNGAGNGAGSNGSPAKPMPSKPASGTGLPQTGDASTLGAAAAAAAGVAAVAMGAKALNGSEN